MISALDHVNILTPQMETMREFYSDVLGFEAGWRPDFSTNGTWMYCEGRAVVHLVDRPDTAGAPEGRIEHFALRGSDREAFVAKLEERGLDYDPNPIPGTAASVVNVRDPDGNHIEVVFGEPVPERA